MELFEGDFWRDPYPAYAHLRAADPVRHLSRADGAWLITRYADVRAALTDPRLAKDWRWTLPPEERADAPTTPIPMMLLMDPPEHTRLRKLVSRSFTVRRTEALRPRVRAYAQELLAALPASGEADLMAAYAFPLPVFVICELLGVPAEDRADFGAWSNTMIDDSTQDEAMTAAGKLHGYLSGLIEDKRARPDDALISALVSDTDADRLSHDELVGMAMLLLVAGHETTVNLLGNAVLALLTHPDQHAALRARPDLVVPAVEEILRWDAPVHSTTLRFATEDVEYSGVQIPTRSTVVLSLAAANRDPDRFPGADELRLDRDAGGHVAFGHGLHYCLGSQLARVEGQEALAALLASGIELSLAVAPEELRYRQSTLVRGVRTLPVRL